jgi:hypothetical protein
VKVRDGKEKGIDAQCKFDKVLGKERILSCSVTDKEQEKREIKKADAGGNVKRIFSKRQRVALKRAFGEIDWQALRPYGPVKHIRYGKTLKYRADRVSR